MQGTRAPVGRRVALTVASLALLGVFWPLSSVVGQEVEQPIIGLEVDADLLAEPWVDPITLFDLEDEPLGQVIDFDLASLHPSDVFEEGVEELAVAAEVDVSVESEQHFRALQAIATAEDARRVAGVGIVTAQETIASSTARIGAAGNEIRILETEIAELRIEIARLVDADNVEIAEQSRLNNEIDANESAIVEIAIQTFIGADDALQSIASDPLSLEPVTRRVVTNQVRDDQRVAIANLEGLVDESNERRTILAGELAIVQAATDRRVSGVERRETEVTNLRGDIVDLRQDISRLADRRVVLGTTIEDTIEFSETTALRYQARYHERLSEFVDGTDLPLVALNAYVRASRTLAVEDPGCGIHWSQLAGIGRIESLHGHFGQSTLDLNGQTTEDIVGLALDGRILSGGGSGNEPDATGRTEETNGVSRLALIRDTDGGILDGDTTFDRAVGPMQFIPSTWRLFDSDGNGDEVIDPQNIYDASLASARYLCAATASVLTAEGEQRAYFAYNHDLAYSQNVTLAGRRYHDAIRIAPEASPSFAGYAASGAAEAAARQAIADAAAAAADEQGDGDEAVDGDGFTVTEDGATGETSEEPQNAEDPEDPEAPTAPIDAIVEPEVLGSTVVSE